MKGFCKICGMKKGLHEKDWKHPFIEDILGEF